MGEDDGGYVGMVNPLIDEADAGVVNGDDGVAAAVCDILDERIGEVIC